MNAYENSNDNSNQNAMSASHLLLSYSANVLRPLSEKATNDKDTILAKIKRYEGMYKKSCVVYYIEM
jgi:hypothetical protein